MTAPDLSPEYVMRTHYCPECSQNVGQWCITSDGLYRIGFVHPLRVTAAFDSQQPQEGAEPSAEAMDKAIEKWGGI